MRYLRCSKPVMLMIGCIGMIGLSSLAVAFVDNPPGITTWAKEVSLAEETFDYRPVSGSVVKAMMYGADDVKTADVGVLLSDRVATLCLSINTRDGAYVARGLANGPFPVPTQLSLTLAGPHWSEVIRKNPHAALMAWSSQNGDCSGESTESMLPASWGIDKSPSTVTFLINSSGLYGRLLLTHAGSDALTPLNCDRLGPSDVSRTYDASCHLDLCTLSAAREVWLEITNFGHRVHLEKLTVPSLSSFCERPR